MTSRPPPEPMLCVAALVTDRDESDAAAKVLLVRHGHRGTWELPGGKVREQLGPYGQAEHPDAAVLREGLEETGLALRLFAAPPRRLDGMPGVAVLVYRARAEGEPVAGFGDVVAEARWFGRDEIPWHAASPLESLTVLREWADSVVGWSEHVRVRVFFRGTGDEWVFQRVADIREILPEGVRITGFDVTFDRAGRWGDLVRIEPVTRPGCASCGTQGPHTGEECLERRPLCRACGVKPTCIQARANGYAPTCLFCFFERGIMLLPENASSDLREEACRRYRLRPPPVRAWGVP